MRPVLNIALRNVFRQRKRSFTLGINYAIVTFILVLVFSFTAGARLNVTTNLVQASAGHITVSGQYIASGRVYNGILRTPEIIAEARSTLGEGSRVLSRYLVRSAVYHKGVSKRLTFLGIDTDAEQGLRDQITFLAGSWQEYAGTANGVVLPLEVAQYFALGYDQEVLMATRTRFGAFNTGVLRVKGIYRTNNFFFQSQVLAHFEFLRTLDLSPADASSAVYVYLPDTGGLGEKRQRLAAALEGRGFEVTRPQSDSEAVAAVTAASPRYQAGEGPDRVRLTLATIDEVLGLARSILTAVTVIGTALAAVMLFIVAVSIFINLRMSINERFREIGTMRTIGVEAGGVTALFVLESVLLAALFSLAAAGLAVGVAALFRTAIVLPLGGNAGLFLNRGHLMLVPRPLDIALILAAILASTVLFSFFPARRGGRIRPVEALTRVF